MDKDKIIQLLEKYWEAESTIEEEKQLKQYMALHEQRDERLIGIWFDSIEDFKSIEPAKPNFTPSGYPSITKAKVFNINFALKVAATIVLISGVLLAGWHYNNIRQAKNNLIVQREAEAGLLSISKTINEGYADLDRSAEIILRGNNKKD